MVDRIVVQHVLRDHMADDCLLDDSLQSLMIDLRAMLSRNHDCMDTY